MEESYERSAEAQLMMATGDVSEIKAGPKTSKVLTSTYSGTSSTQAVLECKEGAAVSLQAVISGSNPQRYNSDYCNFIGFRLPNQF